jgi:hypothetical protein
MRPYKCEHPGCTRAFAAADKRDLHMFRHTGYVWWLTPPSPPVLPPLDLCCACSGRAPDVYVLNTRRTKPFHCSFNPCDKSFDKQSALIKHERCHSGERPFACDHDDCEKRYDSPKTWACEDVSRP